MKNETVGPVQPWWRIRMVWVAFGGPALVVVGCLVTIVLAVRGADPPVARRADAGAATAAGGPATEPAVQARNHAARPGR